MAGVLLVVELLGDAPEEGLAQDLALVGLGEDLLEGLVGAEDRDERCAGVGMALSVSVTVATLPPGGAGCSWFLVERGP